MEGRLKDLQDAIKELKQNEEKLREEIRKEMEETSEKLKSAQSEIMEEKAK